MHLHNYSGQAAVADTRLEKLLGAEEDLLAHFLSITLRRK